MNRTNKPGLQELIGLTDLLALQTENPQRYPFLLQSTANSDSGNNARFEILFAFPSSSIILNASNYSTNDKSIDFLTELDNNWKKEALQFNTPKDIELPFYGGWFLYLGYELAGQIEYRLNLPLPDNAVPIAQATRIPAAIINDKLLNKTFLVTEPGQADYLSDLNNDIVQLKNPDNRNNEYKFDLQEDPDSVYIDQVKRVKRYIYEGDVFQVNLSRKWQGAIPKQIDPAYLYKKLCQTNPAPFSGLAYLNGLTVISSSPERLVSVKNHSIETRPIAGTRPRAELNNDDEALKDELIKHPKERAEHIMLIDLERNDLGRVCKPGTINVNELMVLESYAHVHHIVSNVRGQLKEQTSPADIIRAVFPGGTITGCPKEHCMAIIAELEQEARSAYTGSMGYLNHNGDMDLNILIRTITLDSNNITIRAGAGLVADSDPEKELQETRHKARGMLLAVGAIS
ncbi:MAG: aminodeoxychorismate synthase component I [Gammaproteobacteria bacterium]|nr:aminodeoxychorismate synthase component I [Gammaproteobacteria bacterium]